jgi:hypothetical protein
MARKTTLSLGMLSVFTHTNLDEVDQAVPWVSVVDGFQEALQSMTELHGLEQGEPEGVSIHTIECVVDDDSGASVTLSKTLSGLRQRFGMSFTRV